MTESTPTGDGHPLPLGSSLDALAAANPSAPAVTSDGITLTRGELAASSNRLARAYAALGVGRGDYVTIVLPNGIEWVQSAVAAWKLGAVVAPLSSRMVESEFAEMLALVPRALLVGRESAGIASVPAGFEPDSAVSDAPLPPVVSPIWKAMPSGGSSGRPKLIAATQDSRIDPVPFARMLSLTEGGTQLVIGPLTHNTPLVALVHGLLVGQHVVLQPRFDATECLRLISDLRVTWISTVPTVLQRLLPVYRANPQEFDLSSIQRLWHMAASCPPELKQAWIDILGPEKVWETYGGSESTSVTMISGPEWLEHQGSVGRVALGSMRILDDEGRECPPGTVGEIYMRPPEGVTAMYRYIGSEPTARDGWETIGDLGAFDEEGYLYISDRRIDMFNVGGRKVYPSEVELALLAHPSVLSCLVVGVPDADLGQVGYAVVERAAGSDTDGEELREFLSDRLAGYKIPRSVEFRSESLRDLAGKARRSAVRDEIVGRLSVAARD